MQNIHIPVRSVITCAVQLWLLHVLLTTTVIEHLLSLIALRVEQLGQVEFKAVHSRSVLHSVRVLFAAVLHSILCAPLAVVLLQARLIS